MENMHIHHVEWGYVFISMSDIPYEKGKIASTHDPNPNRRGPDMTVSIIKMWGAME